MGNLLYVRNPAADYSNLTFEGFLDSMIPELCKMQEVKPASYAEIITYSGYP